MEDKRNLEGVLFPRSEEGREFTQGLNKHLSHESFNALSDHGEEAAVARDWAFKEIRLALLVEVEIVELVAHVVLYFANRMMHYPQQSLDPLSPAPQQLLNLVQLLRLPGNKALRSQLLLQGVDCLQCLQSPSAAQRSLLQKLRFAHLEVCDIFNGEKRPRTDVVPNFVLLSWMEEAIG